MTRSRLASLLSVPALAGVLALSACGGGASSSSSGESAHPKNGGSLTLVTTGDAWPSLDPANPVIVPSEALAIPALEPLFYTSPAGKLVPDLAAGYTVSNNDKTITMTLRHGVKFQDGTPFNAQAVVDNLKRYADPKLHSECVTYLSVAKSFTATGPYTVTMQLSSADPGFVPVLGSLQCSLMVSPTAVSKEGASFGSHPVGTGPFKFVSGTTGVVAHYTRWAGYWRKGQPYLNSVTIENVGSGAQALNAVMSGTAQGWMDIVSSGDAPQILQAKSNSSLRVQKAPAGQINYVGFSFTHPPFNNVLAREAVTYATDSAAISKSLYSNLFKPVEGIFPPSIWAYSGPVPGYPTYNPAKARQLVKQLGGLSFTLNVNNTPDWVTEAEALKAQWSKVGINATINEMDTPSWIQSLHNLSYQGLLIVSPPFNDPDNIAYRWFYSSSPLTQNGLKSAQADKLIMQGRSTTNQAARKAAYVQLNQLVSGKEVVWDDILGQNNYQITSTSVQGFPDNPIQYIPFNSISLR